MPENHFNDLISFLNKLLEAERAGVKVLSKLLPQINDSNMEKMVKHFLHDEGMNCQILKTVIENSGGEISTSVGDFVQKIGALETLNEKFELLIRGQEWVAKYIRKNRKLAIKVSDMMFLESIKVQHEENVDRLRAYINKI